MKFNKIPQLRIEVTSRCGPILGKRFYYKCIYCRPGGEGFVVEKELPIEELLEVAKQFVAAGVSHIKITGGEPFVRDEKEMMQLVQGLSEMGVTQIHLVSRSPRAGELAQELAECGLTLLNFSLDSLNPKTWCHIVQIPYPEGVLLHNRFLESIECASATKIPEIKINMVVLKGINDKEIREISEFARKVRAELKLEELIRDVTLYSPNIDNYYQPLNILPYQLFKEEIVREELVYQPGGLGHPMPRLFLKGGGVVTIKTYKKGAWYGDICRMCKFMPCDDALMACRLSPDGKIQICLKRHDNLIDLYSMFKNSSQEKIRKEIKKVLKVYRNAVFYSYSDIVRMREMKNV
jgi:cyclic pyranopterin phosphate synthase